MKKGPVRGMEEAATMEVGLYIKNVTTIVANWAIGVNFASNIEVVIAE